MTLWRPRNCLKVLVQAFKSKLPMGARASHSNDVLRHLFFELGMLRDKGLEVPGAHYSGKIGIGMACASCLVVLDLL